MKKLIFFLCIITVSVIFSCSKSNNTTTPSGGPTFATLKGSVQLYDAAENLVADKSGVTVSVDNSKKTTVSKADGTWSIDSLDFGTYDLTISKAGYGNAKLMGVSHYSNNIGSTIIAKSVLVNEVSNLNITDLKVSRFDAVAGLASVISSGLAENGVYINPVFSGSSERTVRLFFGDSTYSNLSNTNYQVTERYRTTGTGTETRADFPLSWFAEHGFKPGSKVYVRAYGTGWAEDSYLDPINGVLVFPSISTKTVAAVLITLPVK